MSYKNYMESKNDTNRFLLTVRHEFVENKKAILLSVGTILALFFLFGALLGYNGRGGGFTELLVCGTLNLMFSCIGASLAFSNLKTKQSRISAIMLPATSFDKFMVRWLAVVPALLIVLIAGFYVCELTRIFVCWLCDYPWLVNGRYMSIMNPFQVLEIDRSGSLCVSLFSSYLFWQSIYLLGSVLWPKLSFIKTFVVCWAVQTLTGFLFVFAQRLGSFSFLSGVSENGLIISVSSVFFVLTIVMYLLAYWRFKRSQVVYKLF